MNCKPNGIRAQYRKLYDEGYTHHEISDMMGKNPSTVYSALANYDAPVVDHDRFDRATRIRIEKMVRDGVEAIVIAGILNLDHAKIESVVNNLRFRGPKKEMEVPVRQPCGHLCYGGRCVECEMKQFRGVRLTKPEHLLAEVLS